MMQAKREPATDPGPWDCLITDRGYAAGDIVEEGTEGPDCYYAKRNGELVYQFDRQKEINDNNSWMEQTLKAKNIFHPLYNPKP